MPNRAVDPCSHIYHMPYIRMVTCLTCLEIGHRCMYHCACVPSGWNCSFIVGYTKDNSCCLSLFAVPTSEVNGIPVSTNDGRQVLQAIYIRGDSWTDVVTYSVVPTNRNVNTRLHFRYLHRHAY